MVITCVQFFTVADRRELIVIRAIPYTVIGRNGLFHVTINGNVRLTFVARYLLPGGIINGFPRLRGCSRRLFFLITRIIRGVELGFGEYVLLCLYFRQQFLLLTTTQTRTKDRHNGSRRNYQGVGRSFSRASLVILFTGVQGIPRVSNVRRVALGDSPRVGLSNAVLPSVSSLLRSPRHPYIVGLQWFPTPLPRGHFK